MKRNGISEIKSIFSLMLLVILLPVLIYALDEKKENVKKTEDKKSAEPEQKKGDQIMTLSVSSSAFKQNERIPVKYTGDGTDVSPAISWSEPPAGSVEIAIICDDPDAPIAEPWVHWVIFGIPADQKGLPEGKPGRSLPDSPSGIKEGKNSFGKTTYGGPAPPKGHGTHHYFFKVYALDTKITIPAGSSKKDLLKAMEGHILGKGELMGTYSR